MVIRKFTHPCAFNAHFEKFAWKFVRAVKLKIKVPDAVHSFRHKSHNVTVVTT